MIQWTTYSSCQKSMHLKFHRCKVQVVQELKQINPAWRIEYCSWLKRFWRNNIHNQLEITIFTVKIVALGLQRTHIMFHESSLHPYKVGVWCVISRQKVMTLTFFESNINTIICSGVIYQFFASLEDNERIVGYSRMVQLVILLKKQWKWFVDFLK